MKEDYAARPKVLRDFAQHFTRIGLCPQHIATNNKIERPLEHHFAWIALAKRDLSFSTRHGSFSRHRNRGWSNMGAHHLARGTYQVGCQEGDGACPAADIEHAHTRCHACASKVLAGCRFEELRLASQALKFEIGMAKDVTWVCHGDMMRTVMSARSLQSRSS